MVSPNFKLAVLSALAKWPERRFILDELRKEIETIVISENQTERLKRFPALHDVDIFQSGLVSRDDDGFRITEAGISLLHSLESSSEFSPEPRSAPVSQPFRLIDDLLGAEERLKIFDLELRTLEGGAGEGGDHQSEHEEENEAAPIKAPDAALETNATDLSGKIDTQTLDGAVEDIYDRPSENAPAFLRRGFGSKAPEPDQDSSPLVRLFASTATRTQSMIASWRNHFVRGESTPTEPVTGWAGVAFAFLSLLVLVSCVGAAIALRQITSLKSEIATLHRDLLPLRERVGKLEQTEKAKRESDQQEAAPDKSGTAANKPGEDNRADQGGLSLSHEEVELIRNYIKPAPSADIAAPAINVGDAVSGATIPLPSQLAEKIPRLLGARFTTRNGAIIIVRRNSHQADAVLAPN